jgi:hypothetical protein
VTPRACLSEHNAIGTWLEVARGQGINWQTIQCSQVDLELVGALSYMEQGQRSPPTECGPLNVGKLQECGPTHTCASRRGLQLAPEGLLKAVRNKICWSKRDLTWQPSIGAIVSKRLVRGFRLLCLSHGFCQKPLEKIAVAVALEHCNIKGMHGQSSQPRSKDE